MEQQTLDVAITLKAEEHFKKVSSIFDRLPNFLVLGLCFIIVFALSYGIVCGVTKIPYTSPFRCILGASCGIVSGCATILVIIFVKRRWTWLDPRTDLASEACMTVIMLVGILCTTLALRESAEECDDKTGLLAASAISFSYIYLITTIFYNIVFIDRSTGFITGSLIVVLLGYSLPVAVHGSNLCNS